MINIIIIIIINLESGEIMRSERRILFDPGNKISLDDISCDLPKIRIKTNSSNSLLDN
jgi:hypothetical protein